MLVAHLSDLHLGRKFPGNQYDSERLNSLRQAIVNLSSLSPSAILIAGDTFDSPQIDKAVVQEAAKILERAQGKNGERIPVVLIPGNHDPADSRSLWQSFQSALAKDSGVRVVLAPEVVVLGGGSLVVEAYPCETRYSAEPPWARRLSPPDSGPDAVRVVLAHGTLQGGPVPEGETDAYPFGEDDLEGLAAEYTALGHFHSLYPSWKGDGEILRSYSYSGTHEPDQFAGDSGYAILAAIDKGAPTRLQRIKVANRCWRLLEIGGALDLAKINELRAEVEGGDPRRFVIRFKVNGKTQLSPEEADIVNRAEAGLRALGVQVERQGEWQAMVDVGLLDFSALPSGAVKAALLSLQEELSQLNEPSKREVLEAALQLGWQKINEPS